ncbi:hypothetical protein KUTeg_001843, partial [Tegillarca granosa]
MMNQTEDRPTVVEAYIEGSLLSLISVTAMFGNLSMWLIICRTRDLRTYTNYFILSLSLADLFVAVVNMPVTVITLFMRGWIMSDSACKVFGYLNMLTLVTSVMSLCNISINRYIMVCRPIHFKSIYTKWKSAAMIAACFGTSVLLSSPPLFGWAEYSFIQIQSFCFCDWTKAPSYAFFMIGTCFGIPFSVMTVCNIQIFRRVRASKKRVSAFNKTNNDETLTKHQRKTKNCFSSNDDHDKMFVVSKRISKEMSLSASNELYSAVDEVTVVVDGETACAFNNNENHKTLKKELRKVRQKARAEEIRLATALAVVVVVFVICWLPYCFSMLISIYNPLAAPRAFHMGTLLIGYANSCCNPVIYGVMNKKFADGYHRLYCSKCIRGR